MGVVGVLGFPPLYAKIAKIPGRIALRVRPVLPSQARLIAERTDRPREIRFRNPELDPMRQLRVVQNVTTPYGREPISASLRAGESVTFECPEDIKDDDYINVSYYTIGHRHPALWWERLFLRREQHSESIRGVELARDGEAALAERVRRIEEVGSSIFRDGPEYREKYKGL